MKSQILLLALTVAVLSSCTTSYKTGQTPDDVYFSPARQQGDEYVQTEDKDDRRYQSREDYYDDRYLRMRVSNRQRWSELDDYYYYGNRYDYSYYNNYNLNNPWSPCNYWNSHYNPYFQSYVIVTPRSPVFNHPRNVNLNTYNNTMLTNNHYTNPTHPGFSIVRPVGNSNGNSANTNSNSGNFLRNVFNNNSSSSNNNNNSSGGTRPATTTSSSSGSSGSSSGSSGGSTAPVRRF